MFSKLSVPYVDVRPGDLRWALDLPPLEALVELPVVSGGFAIDVRVLGTSHQIIVSGPEGTRFSETVACGLDGAPLPGNVKRNLAAISYGMVSTVEQLPYDILEERVRELVDALRERPDALVGAFPAEPLAVTALSVEASEPEYGRTSRIEWRSWHCYPQTGHLVSTHTSLHTMDTMSARATL